MWQTVFIHTFLFPFISTFLETQFLSCLFYSSVTELHIVFDLLSCVKIFFYFLIVRDGPDGLTNKQWIHDFQGNKEVHNTAGWYLHAIST